MGSSWGQRQQYGEFRIVGAGEGRARLLGEGSFGKTFEAVRFDSVAGNVIEENVALKVLNPDLLNSASKRIQFVQERTALTRLKHANLIHSIKCGEDNGEVYFAMELCMGGDLAQLVRRFGALPERVAALIGLQAAAGLREMHRRDMVHRDIKPPNIMLFEPLSPGCTLDELTRLLEENESLCRIVDFGLVGTIMNDPGGADPAVAHKFVGTMMYASPEQILKGKDIDGHKDIDGRTDIYALGMTLWYLVQGRGPLLDARGDELKHAAEAEGRHLSSSEHEPDLPHNLSQEFRGILARMVAKRPDERAPNAKELATALERYLERAPCVREVALPSVASRERLHSFFDFREDSLRSLGRRRFAAEHCATKRQARLTIVEDLDESDKIRSDFNDVVKKVYDLAQNLRQPNVPATLLPVQDVVWAADALAYAEDVPGDVTLAEVLQARTAARRPFSFREAEVIFRPIAGALDYLINKGWDLVSLPCEEVWLSDPALAAAPDDKTTLCHPLNEWTGLRVTFSGMWVPPERGKATGAENSFASTAEGGSSFITSESLRPPVSAFLRLVYRTLSGSDVPDAADRWQNGYISSVALQTASNNLIRDMLCKQREWSSVSLILNELCANEGVSVDAPVISSSKRSSRSTRSSSAKSTVVPGATSTSIASAASSRSATRSAASSTQQSQFQQPVSPRQSSRASSRSSTSQPAAADVSMEAPAVQETPAPQRGKMVWVLAGVAAVAIAALTLMFFPRKGRTDLSHFSPPPAVAPASAAPEPPVSPPTPERTIPVVVKAPTQTVAATNLQPPVKPSPPVIAPPVEFGSPVTVRTTSSGQILHVYDGSVALVIRCEKYVAGWGNFEPNPRQHAMWREMLEKNGFAVQELVNPDAITLRHRLETFWRDSAPKKDSDVRYLVYFCGQSHTTTTSFGSIETFLVPVDAPKPEENQAEFLSKAVPVSALEQLAQGLQSKHALFVLNAPASCGFVSRAGLGSTPLSAVIGDGARHFIVVTERADLWSAAMAEQFLDRVMNGMRGGADGDGDSYVTGTELGGFVSGLNGESAGLPSLRPYHGKLRHQAWEKGEIAFRSLEPQQPQRAAPVGGAPSIAAKEMIPPQVVKPAVAPQPLPTEVVAGMPFQNASGHRMMWVADGSYELRDAATANAADGATAAAPAVQKVDVKGLWMAETEVNLASLAEVLGLTSPTNNPKGVATHVSWTDATHYCEKINQAEAAAGRVPDGFAYRLPTESEWELAAISESQVCRRPGSSTPFDASLQLSADDSRPPNAKGIRDLISGVREWCFTLSSQPAVVRGDFQNADIDRVSARFTHYDREKGYPEVGFRVVLAPQLEDAPPMTPMVAGGLPAAPVDLTRPLKANEMFVQSGYKDFNSYARSRILRKAQTKWKELGLYDKPVDGDPGASTHAALLAYQKQKGLTITGMMDESTLKALGLDQESEEHEPKRKSTARKSTTSESEPSAARKIWGAVLGAKDKVVDKIKKVGK